MEPIIRKTYYSIGEVSDLTGLKPHVLRYWETQFDILSPTKNRGGTRVYRNREIESILLVKHLLYEKRFTIEGAKRELQEMRDGERMAEVRKLNAEPAVLATIKEGLTALREELTLPQREDQGT
ncbi:MAG: MerR family transcriptional regulator [Gemmatimonadetes bacterium]|nr:MerR family transcriptional regulator [Gemmatimonadota bacterium]MXX71934.1 MerR family transcriptional regulator [Gemmatimonadota bacterium]MYC91809.1 MerR family transcriptional regulator [Gemmatimonadota bacterium]MYG37382.1 MerR family transcriptional regulator [Gemmatimonadota bacterium]MYJ16658.1 MerR family transcriptional regulator [Gemmatimonadota bacterium]